jgi:sialic acid synthase SpsE
MATPFDEEIVDLLEGIGCDAFKIASGDLTHHALIERLARTGAPVVLSTGMASFDEAAEATHRAHTAGVRQLALLHCVSVYPTPLDGQNLGAIADLARLGRPVGLSDHSVDPYAAALTAALGGSIYEKHLILDAASDAVDAPVSATPEELSAIIQRAEAARLAVGSRRKERLPIEQSNALSSRRSLYAARNLDAGHRVTPADVSALRPADGLDPRLYRQLLGVSLRRAVAAGEPFLPEDLGFALEEAS